MNYYIYSLKFNTPVHFGDDVHSGNLNDIQLSCCADTFFSALCSEASLMANNHLDELIQKVQAKKIAISSLFPYFLQEKSATQNYDLLLFLPKPLLHIEANYNSIKPFAKMKKFTNRNKQMNNTKFIRVSELKNYFLAKKAKEVPFYPLPELATKLSTTKVNGRNSQPYTISSYKFHDNAGLYFVAGFDNDDDELWFNELVESLGYSGIGGRRSSGHGKFELADSYEISDGFYKDDKLLYDMLQNTRSDVQMCIAPIIPNLINTSIIGNQSTDLSYQLIKRSGYISSSEAVYRIKRDTIYMIAEGSCFGQQIEGTMQPYTYNQLSHKVYRNGMGMFVGI